MGRLNSGGTGILTNDPAVALRRKMNWSMDALGNWNASELAYSPPTGFSRYDYLDGHTSPDVTTNVNHTVDAFNRITGVTTDDVPVAHVNDSAGNLVFDGTYVYQYDAWNRLTEVNEADSLTSADFAPDGKINPTAGHEIGSLVIRFAYDGLGRLIMAQKVHSGSAPDPVYRTEHYYYDGVRRIQEVDDNATPSNTADDETKHEYVYGPDYVDEFVLESQRAVVNEEVIQQPFYVLQDANYNVMALTDGTGGVLEQYQWEPYGLLATKDTAGTPAPHSHIGHQGLFFYRFDDATAPPIALNAVGLYHNRNRWYSPTLGRFASRDPNETAQLIINAMRKNGQSLFVLAGTFDAAGHFGDGMNLFSRSGSNPLLWSDPSGLFSYIELGLASSEQSYLGAAIAGAATGAFSYFTIGIANGMAWQNAALEAACLGATLFVGFGGLAESYFAMSQSFGATAAATATGTAAGNGIIAGLYGQTTRATLLRLAAAGGATTRVVTNLSGPPQAGRALSVATGQGADALAQAAPLGTRLYQAMIPNALLVEMETVGLASRYMCEMGGVRGVEIRFLPAATEFIVGLFLPK